MLVRKKLKSTVTISEANHFQFQVKWSPNAKTFVPNEFTLEALDNFDCSDKKSFSGLFSSHDAAMISFQIKP